MWTAIILMSLSCIASTIEVTGTATTLDGKKSLYTEYHRIELDAEGLNKKIETTYTKDGSTFAKMTTNFEKDRFVPEVTFEDHRFSTRQMLQWLESGRVRFKTDKEGATQKERTLSFSGTSVAGQGFDNFIKSNFDRLRKDPIPLQYGVLGEMDFFSFEGRTLPSTSQNLVRFGIHMRNPLLRIFVDELEVEYDTLKRRLMTYKGLSNLLDDQGRSQNVLIKYQWREISNAK